MQAVTQDLPNQYSPGLPVLELRYLGEVIGWVDAACAFQPVSEDALYLNRAIVRLFGVLLA